MATELKNGVAESKRRFRFDLSTGRKVEVVFQPGDDTAMARYIPSTPLHGLRDLAGQAFTSKSLASCLRDESGWYEVEPGVPSPPSQQESLPAPTAETQPSAVAPSAADVTDEFLEAVELEIGMGSAAWDCVNAKALIAAVIRHYLNQVAATDAATPPSEDFVIDTGTVDAVASALQDEDHDSDGEVSADRLERLAANWLDSLPPEHVAHCNDVEQMIAMCVEPDAEETIDEYVARIDEGVVSSESDPSVIAIGQRFIEVNSGEWPKSYAWHQDATDIITLRGPYEQVVCKSGYTWDYKKVVEGTPGFWIPHNGNAKVPVAVDSRDAEIAELKRQLAVKNETIAANGIDNRRMETELTLHRQFHTDALAAHAEASPNRVEIMFGRACDKLRAGLRGLDSAPKEEESASSQPLKMEAVPT
jgi:hypothetical protein